MYSSQHISSNMQVTSANKKDCLNISKREYLITSRSTLNELGIWLCAITNEVGVVVSVFSADEIACDAGCHPTFE